MSQELNATALSPPFDHHAATGDWLEYAKALSRRGLSWFLDMDIPCLYLHLLPLGSESASISQTDRLSFLFDLVNPESPPDRFEAHYRFYKQEKEPEYRMAAAIAGVTAVWQSGREFERLDRWMARIDDCLAEKGLSEQSRAAAEIVQGIVQCMAWGRLTAAIEKLQSALHWGDKAGSASQKVLAGAFLAYYRLINGDFTRGELALFDIAPLAELPQIPLYCKVHFICFRAIFHYLNRDIAQARDRLVEVVEHPLFESLPALTHLMVYNFLLTAAAVNQDMALVETVVGKIQQRAIPEENRYSHAMLHYCLALASLFKKEPYKALLHERQSVELLVGMSERGVGFYWNAVVRGQALADLNETEAALAHFKDWLARWRADGYWLMYYFGALEMANLLLMRGKTKEAARYHEMAKGAIPHKASLPVLARPIDFPKAIQQALFPDYGTVSHARELRETPICIQTLGGFTMRVQGETIYDRNWRSKRTKQLLKALIVFGGSKVSMDLLADTLWPDADGDHAMNSLRVTCSRLRRIGCAPGVKPLNWIKVFHGQVSMIRSLCEVDAIRFQELLALALAEDQADAIISALDGYSGDFLPHDRSETWIIEHRHRLRAEYARGAMALTRHCLGRQCPEKAMPHLTKSLEASPLDEPLHTLAMRVYLAMGYPSHAIQIYRRIEKSLYQELDASPGQELIHLLEKAKRH